MIHPPGKSAKRVALVQLIPNMLTIAAICAGLTSIRFALAGGFDHAAHLIMVAALLDGIDGRIARLLRSDSKIGAELDSLADFVNFGVATPLVLYLWTLQDMRSLGWIALLIYAICCVIRLARFNIGAKSADAALAERPAAHFVGVPSPAGAFLLLLPMFVAFAFPEVPRAPDLLVCLHMVVVGLAMISTIPTYSFKNARVSRENVKFYLVGFAVVAAAALTFFWVVMVLLCLGYVGLVIWGLLARAARGRRKGH